MFTGDFVKKAGGFFFWFLFLLSHSLIQSCGKRKNHHVHSIVKTGVHSVMLSKRLVRGDGGLNLATKLNQPQLLEKKIYHGQIFTNENNNLFEQDLKNK